MLCKRGLCGHAVSVCLSVCPSVSVTFVDYVKTNKHIFNFFSSSGSHIILVFLYQTAWRHSDGNPPNGGVDCRWSRLKSRNQRLSGLEINNCCTVVCISHLAAGVLFAVGIGRPSAIDVLLSTVRDRPSAVSRCTQSRWTWIVYLTVRQYVTPKTTEQNRTVRTSKSEAEGIL